MGTLLSFARTGRSQGRPVAAPTQGDAPAPVGTAAFAADRAKAEVNGLRAQERLAYTLGLLVGNAERGGARVAPGLIEEGRDLLRRVSALDFASATPDTVAEVRSLQAALEDWRARLLG